MAFVIKPLQSFTAEAQGQNNDKLYLYQIDPLLIEEEDGFNLRYYENPKVAEHIEAFCESFLRGRYVPPMVVRALEDGRIVVIEGHCRRRGLRMAIARGASIPRVSVIPFRGNDAERVELMLRSAQGLKLEALDVARGYLRLSHLGFSPSAIAASQSKTVARVEQFLLLARADPQVQALVRGNHVSPDAAIEALLTHGDAAAPVLNQKLDEARREGRLRLTRTVKTTKSRPPRKTVEKVFAGVEAAMGALPLELRRQVARLRKLPEAERSARMVEVSAQLLVSLAQAGREIERMQARRARRLAKLEAAQPPDPASPDPASMPTEA
ncbi:ParB/RepB/Spo0J family partition protein [Acidocella sp.]|uniref:ParB/RepB/Spo0J family partition protein n=1 Tax=Acidocella sp. TaxID=50710 RepID=UPI003D093896